MRRIQPQPPAPPAAPAGTLDDDDLDRPIGIRRVRRGQRPVVTPPGDRPRGPARARRSIVGRVLAILLLALIALLVVGVFQVFQPFGTAIGPQVRVTIPQGATTAEIGEELERAGVIDSAFIFGLRARLSGARADLRSGTHTLNEDMSYGKVLAALSDTSVSTKAKTVSVTLPEGRTRAQMAQIARAAGLKGSYLEASKRFAGALSPFAYGAPAGTRSTEGFLFPATYELEPRAPARELVEAQLKAFKENFASVDLKRARSKNLTAYDVLIIASLVEGEAQLDSERRLIAAVIYNRLKDGIPLGIDAANRYALKKPSGALTQSELASDSPYNTRKRAGLPPTPIGNPGLASIRAAANPANVGYRYFVVKPGTCGKHAFSSTSEQFARDSARYNAARAAAGNRSPTTC